MSIGESVDLSRVEEKVILPLREMTAYERALALGTVRAVLTSELKLSIWSLLECQIAGGEYPLNRVGKLSLGDLTRQVELQFLAGARDGE